VFLSREDLVAASPLIVSHFRRFGLTIHTGVRSKNESSKTEAMHFPRRGQDSSAADEADINLDGDRFFSFTDTFKYLGSTFTKDLSDSFDVKKRIGQARGAFNAMNQQVLRNKRIPKAIRRRIYQAIVVNLALWGCESWALKADDRNKLESFHHGCLRRMCNLTMWDVKAKRITNEQVRHMADKCNSMKSLMELRRCRWLAKLSKMDETRAPRRLLAAWLPTPRLSGKPQQTIRHAYITTLETLGFKGQKGNLAAWMTLAREKGRGWANLVESRLFLHHGTYSYAHD
jgi:hypothetical protein